MSILDVDQAHADPLLGVGGDGEVGELTLLHPDVPVRVNPATSEPLLPDNINHLVNNPGLSGENISRMMSWLEFVKGMLSMIKNDEDVKTESFNGKNILIFRFEYFASSNV